jgi:predicted nucleotidyltransferase
MQKDWIELCKLFTDQGVEFLLVGGQAVIAYGYPRLTKDMDLWVRPTASNGQKVLEALDKVGLRPNLDASRFEDPTLLLAMGRPPFRIDLLTDLPGIRFDSAWMRRGTITLDGVVVPLLALDDLLANKRAVGRPQDLADVAELEALQSAKRSD